MKKRIISFAIIIVTLLCVIPFGSFTEVNAKAMSNASALTATTYNKGTYVSLNKMTIYKNYDGKKSTGKSIPTGTSFNAASVHGQFGKVTYKGTTGWVDLSYAYNSKNTVNVSARLNMLRKKFPAGKYWNKPSSDKNNPNGYTNVPCANGHKDKRCNYFDGTCQCHGFSIKLGYDLFGIHPYYWERHYDLSKVKVGDLIRYRGHHTVMITGVHKTYFTVADCNWMYHCGIEWDRKMDKSYFSFYKNNKNDGIYHCPTNGGYIFKKTANTTTTTTKKATTTTKKATTTTTKKATTTTTKKATTTTTTTTTAAVTTSTTRSASVVLGQVSSTSKFVLTTKLSVQGSSTAVLAKSEDELYTAQGVTKDGVTSFTFNAPAGKYPELVIIVDGCEEYCLDDFTLGKDSLPGTVKVVKAETKAAGTTELKITSQPANVSVKSGADATFTVKATGAGLKYQWYYMKSGETAWTLWKGRIAPTFTVASNDSWNGMQVRCKITDGNGKSVTSSAAKVTVDINITKQPANVTVKSGDDATFSLKAAGVGLKYQWYYRKSGETVWTLWKGRIAPTFTVASNDSWNGMAVYCMITDANGKSLQSGQAKVTLK